VIVPVGSIEQHGPHCPQAGDIPIPYHLAIQAAAGVDEFPVIVAPLISLGSTDFNMGEVGTISLSLETFNNVVCDVSRSIWANGFRRLNLLNGHGGNEQPTWAAAVKLAEEDVWPLFSVLRERLVALCHEYHEIDPLKYREFGSHCAQAGQTLNQGSRRGASAIARFAPSRCRYRGLERIAGAGSGTQLFRVRS
jgi:hypothetical protein